VNAGCALHLAGRVHPQRCIGVHPGPRQRPAVAGRCNSRADSTRATRVTGWAAQAWLARCRFASLAGFQEGGNLPCHERAQGTVRVGRAALRLTSNVPPPDLQSLPSSMARSLPPMAQRASQRFDRLGATSSNCPPASVNRRSGVGVLVRRPHSLSWCPGPDSNRHALRLRIFWPLRLSPPRCAFVVWTLP
jgi:hypothetical protein